MGGGQDVPAIFNSALAVSNSRITNNAGRGVDILNRHQQDTFVTLTNNDILSNGLEGVYVVNTASINQLQRNSADQLEVYIEPSLGATPGTPNPNIELRVQDNLIQSNGTAAAQSRVPTVFELATTTHLVSQILTGSRHDSCSRYTWRPRNSSRYRSLFGHYSSGRSGL